MKRESLLRHLRKHGCYLKREGKAHSLWCNPKNGSWKPFLGTQKFQTYLQEKSVEVSPFQRSESSAGQPHVRADTIRSLLSLSARNGKRHLSTAKVFRLSFVIGSKPSLLASGTAQLERLAAAGWDVHDEHIIRRI